MVRRIAKMIAYAKAPRGTFMVLHPMRALKYGAAYVVGRTLIESMAGESNGRRRRRR